MQHIDACDRGGRSIEPTPNEDRSGKIPRVFGCLDVTITWTGFTDSIKNKYNVVVTDSKNQKKLMECKVTEEISLKNVIVELNKLSKTTYKDTRTKNRSSECENSSSATLTEVSFFGDIDDSIKILCIESLKTMCDKLYQLSKGVEYINSVDRMVSFDPCLNYYGGEIKSCPMNVCSDLAGFFKTEGTIETNNCSDIFYRNFVLLCFFRNSGYQDVIGSFSRVSNILEKQELLPQIKSSRLTNYIERLNTLQEELCLNKERTLQLDDPYDQWMIRIICCELNDKINVKIPNYIKNVSNILGNFNRVNKFDEFYRSIIGLEDLEKLLTMSSFSFYSSNEDSIFKPDRKNIPETNSNKYGIQGSWTNRNIRERTKIDHVGEADIEYVLNSIDNVEYDGDNTVIIFNNNSEELINNLKKMIDENDTENGTNIIGDRNIIGQYASKKVKTLTTPTTLELLFMLLKNLESNSEVTQSSKKSRAVRNKQDGQHNKQYVKENIKNKIIHITSDFINQIGLDCGNESFLNVPFLNSLFQLDPPTSNSSKDVKMDLEFHKTQQPHIFSCSDSPGGCGTPRKNDTEYNSNKTRKISHPLFPLISPQPINRGVFEQGTVTSTLPLPPKTSYRFPPLTPSLPQKRADKTGKNTSQRIKSANKEIGKILNLPPISANFNKTGKNNYTMKKGGRKPKFTRRKNKKSPKRKTIKKRKMPKRKNKTRRNK